MLPTRITRSSRSPFSLAVIGVILALAIAAMVLTRAHLGRVHG